MQPTDTHKLAGQHPKPEPAPETTEQKAPEITVAQHMKIVSFACLEASMRYREAFWREDIEALNEALRKENDFTLNNGTFTQKKNILKKISSQVLDLQAKLEKFNGLIYKELEDFNKLFSQENQKSFDNYSTAYGLLADEMLKARNTTDMLIICKMYNAGQMDAALSELKNIEQADKLNKEFDAKNTNEPVFVIKAENFEEYRKDGWIWCSREFEIPPAETKVRVLYENGQSGTCFFWSEDEGFDPYQEPLHIAIIAWKPLEDEVIADGDHLGTGKNNVGKPIDIPDAPVKLEVVRGETLDIPDSQKSEC